MRPIECGILRTVLYADVFQYALSAEEIHYYLLYNRPVPLADVQDTLATSDYLRTVLAIEADYIALCTQPGNIAQRREREALTQQLWPTAQRYGRWLANLPFVRMVALTGALAMHNPAGPHDDYDYLLLTQPGRVWLARAFAVLLVRLVRLRGHEICPNYVLASDDLLQTRQDVYMAHEMVQMIPLYGLPLYEAMQCANDWAQDYMPNAIAQHKPRKQPQQHLKRALEWVLQGRMGNALERWEQTRKLRKFAAQVQTATPSDARLDAGAVKGHFADHGSPILTAYRQRLHAYGLD